MYTSELHSSNERAPEERMFLWKFGRENIRLDMIFPFFKFQNNSVKTRGY